MKSSQLRARYWRIVFFFGRVTASFIFWEIFLPRIGLGGWSARTRSERYRRIAVRFRALAIRMGGLMIKVGQFLSARLDVLPPEITRRARRPAGRGARRGVRRHPRAGRGRARRAARRALRLGRRDADGRRVARAGAPGAAVRRRRPRLHGFEDVVVKVQRPYIEQIVEVDLAALRRVGGWLQRYKPISKRADVPRAGRGVRGTTREEIDYVAEGQQRRDLRRQLQGRPARPRSARSSGTSAPAAC